MSYCQLCIWTRTRKIPMFHANSLGIFSLKMLWHKTPEVFTQLLITCISRHIRFCVIRIQTAAISTQYTNGILCSHCHPFICAVCVVLEEALLRNSTPFLLLYMPIKSPTSLPPFKSKLFVILRLLKCSLLLCSLLSFLIIVASRLSTCMN